MQLLEALSPFGNNGNTLPHSLPQTLPPLVCNHTDHTDREAGRWRTVGVAHGQARKNPDVPRPQQAHLSRLLKQKLCLLIGAVRQQNPGVHLQTRNTFVREERKYSLNMQGLQQMLNFIINQSIDNFLD